VGASTHKRLAAGVFVVAVVSAVALFVASGRGARTELSTTGVIVGVQAEDVRSFSLRTETGQVVEFMIGTLQNPTEFPPSHLAEHQATGQPVRVRYLQQGESKVAVRIDDAS
jgi:hypothetical protein